MLLDTESEVKVEGGNGNKIQDKDKQEDEVVDKHEDEDDGRDDDNLNSGVDFAYRNCDEDGVEDGVEVSASYYDEVHDKDEREDDDEDDNDWTSLTLEGLLEEATKAILLKHEGDIEATESKLKNIITTLRTDVTNLQQKNSTLTIEKEQSMAEVKRGNATNTTLRTEVANLQQTNSTLVTEKEQAIIEIDKGKAAINTFRTEVTNLQKTNSTLTTEKEQSMAEVERGNATIATLRTENAILQQTNSTLATEKEQAIVEIDKGKAAMITIRTEVAILQQTNSTLTTEKEQAIVEADLLARETKVTLQRANDETEQERETIRMKEKILSDLKAEKADQEAQFEDVRTQLEEVTTENQLLLPLTSQLQTRIDMLMEKVRIISDLKAENVNQQTQLDDIRTQLEAATTENDRLLPLTNQLQTRINMLMEEVQIVSKLKEEKVVHQKQLKDVRTQLETATTENQRIVPLTNQLQVRNNMLVEEGQIIADLKVEKGIQQTQLENVRTQLEATATENQRLLPLTHQLQTKIDMLTEEVQIVSELKAEQVVHQKQLGDVRTQLEAATTENERIGPLTNQLQTRNNMLVEERQIIVDLKVEKGIQQTQLGNVRTQLEATTTENQRLLPLTNQLQTRIDMLTEEVKIVSELKAEKVVHQTQLEDVRTQLEAAMTENERIVPLTNQLQTRNNVVVEERQIIADLKEEKGIQQTQLENVRTQLEATTTENQRLLPLTNQLQTRIDTLTEVGVAHQTQLGDVCTQLEAATTENDRLIPLTNQLQTRINVLMEEFQIISELKAEKVVHQQQLEDVTAQLVASLAENQRTEPLMNQLQERIEMLTDVVQNNLMK